MKCPHSSITDIDVLQVIEVSLVPPETSAISNMTPTSGAPDDSRVRVKRFVVIRDQTQFENSFEAWLVVSCLAICDRANAS